MDMLISRGYLLLHVAFSALAFSACTSDNSAPVDPRPVVASVTLTPADTTLKPGESIPLAATARSVSGDVISGRTTSWTTSSAAVVSVSSTGVITAVSSGSASISATIDGRTAAAQIRVSEVIAPGSFSFNPSLPYITVVQGGSPATATIGIVRQDGFDAPVNLVISGAPAGLAATFDQATAAGDRVTLAVKADASARIQHLSLTIIGTAPSKATASIILRVVVLPSAGNGKITLDYAECFAQGDSPVWVAVQDGTGPWFQVVGEKGVFQFSVTAERVGIAIAWNGDYSGKYLGVSYMTRQEATGPTYVACMPLDGKALYGGVAGLTNPEDVARVSMGGGYSDDVRYPSKAFRVYPVPLGQQDLVAYRANRNGPAATDRVVIVRDLDVPANGSLPTVAFDGVNAFAPIASTLTVQGATASEQLSHTMSYLTGVDCRGSTLYSAAAASTTGLTMFGVPTERQRPTDYHAISVSAETNASRRGVTETFHSMGNRALALGKQLPTPSISTLPGPFLRLQAALDIPPEYEGSASLSYYTNSAPGYVQLSATSGWLGGRAVTLAVPDFSTVGGWNNELAPPLGANVEWSVEAHMPWLGTGDGCTEGGVSRWAMMSGMR